MSHIITQSRKEAEDLAKQIHEWRKANIPGYNATTWSDCIEEDVKFDAKHKAKDLAKWAVPLPHDLDEHESLKELCKPKVGQERVDELPDGWNPAPIETVK